MRKPGQEMTAFASAITALHPGPTALLVAAINMLAFAHERPNRSCLLNQMACAVQIPPM